MKRDDNQRPSNKLTSQQLKDMILQVLQDSYTDLIDNSPQELLAEPQEPLEDPPDPLNENKIMNKFIRALNQLDADTRTKIFAKFGYYTQANLLKHLNSVKKASAGKL